MRIHGGSGTTGADYSHAIWTGSGSFGTLPQAVGSLNTQSVYRSPAVDTLPVVELLIRDETSDNLRATRRTYWTGLKPKYSGKTFKTWFTESVYQGFKTCDHNNRVDAATAVGRWSLWQESQNNDGNPTTWGLYVNFGNNGRQARLSPFGCTSSNQTEWAGFGPSSGCNLSGVTQGGYNQRRDLANDSTPIARHECVNSAISPTTWTIWAR